MIYKDTFLLEKAYLAISQPVPSVPSDEKNEKPVDMGVATNGVPEEEVGCEYAAQGCECGCCPDCSCNDSHEETSVSHDHAPKHEEYSSEDLDMVISNLNSIRESLTKIAMCCASGKGLEAWQEQKIAVAMDNLAEVARRVH